MIRRSLFCIYIDDLIKELRREKEGCWISNKYVGIDVYADDIVLLSPSLDGLQNMVNTCCNYAKSFNVEFSTHENVHKSKTKCMAFLNNKHSLNSLQLGDNYLPWVESAKHLGVVIEI